MMLRNLCGNYAHIAHDASSYAYYILTIIQLLRSRVHLYKHLFISKKYLKVHEKLVKKICTNLSVLSKNLCTDQNIKLLIKKLRVNKQFVFKNFTCHVLLEKKHVKTQSDHED